MGRGGGRCLCFGFFCVSCLAILPPSRLGVGHNGAEASMTGRGGARPARARGWRSGGRRPDCDRRQTMRGGVRDVYIHMEGATRAARWESTSHRGGKTRHEQAGVPAPGHGCAGACLPHPLHSFLLPVIGMAAVVVVVVVVAVVAVGRHGSVAPLPPPLRRPPPLPPPLPRLLPSLPRPPTCHGTSRRPRAAATAPVSLGAARAARRQARVTRAPPPPVPRRRARRASTPPDRRRGRGQWGSGSWRGAHGGRRVPPTAGRACRRFVGRHTTRTVCPTRHHHRRW